MRPTPSAEPFGSSTPPLMYELGSPAKIAYVSSRASRPAATLSGDASAPTSNARTAEKFSTSWSYEKPPASNVVGLAVPIERFNVFSTPNCISFVPNVNDVSRAQSAASQVAPAAAL